MDLVLRVCQHRLTTPGRLRAELGEMPRHRWRSLVQEVLAEVVDGVQSPLERRYLHRVERLHGLPRAVRNAREPDPAGGYAYRDLRYCECGLVVELDGAEAHPRDQAFRDRIRDNRSVRAGSITLRYGWHEISGDPGGVAAEVAAVLAARGWTGSPRRCGPGCPLKS